jgi:hypothetical protein
VAQTITKSISKLQTGTGNYVHLSQLRELPEIKAMGPDFEKNILQLQRDGKIILGKWELSRDLLDKDPHAQSYIHVPDPDEPPGKYGPTDPGREIIYSSAALPRR